MLAIFTLTGLHHVQTTLDKDITSTTQHYNHLLQFVVPHVQEERSPSSIYIDDKQQQAMQESENTKPDVKSRTTCLEHPPMTFNSTGKRVSDPTVRVIEHTKATICGKLRRNWYNNNYNEQPIPLLSNIAQQILHHQSNCSLPVGNNVVDNSYGLGSHIMLWSQSICNAIEEGYRVRTYVQPSSQPSQSQSSEENVWLWLDQYYCDINVATTQSPMLCYFPQSEYRCSNNNNNENNELVVLHNISDARDKKKRCKLLRGDNNNNNEEVLKEFRAASMEYLFHNINPLIIKEAQRQIGVIFQTKYVPQDLICVHIRWGDKFFEMKLPTIQEYIDAINVLTKNATTANIYLATEDPKAVNEFLQIAKQYNGWNVYYDITIQELNAFRPIKGNRASYTTKNTKGRAGLIALGSLLVSLEAKYFVLTTKSNWSALLNYLRMNIIDPQCNNCTTMIDLRPGIW